MKMKMIVLAISAAIFSGYSIGAFAEENGSKESEPSGNSEHGQDTSSSGRTTQLENITVTARKREESAQSTPISMTVMSSSDLANHSVQSLQDIEKLTPSLKIAPAIYAASSYWYSIRGQSAQDSHLNADQSVAVYQDGVYIPRSVAADAADLFDLERIEVLKGPQGTLFGRNSTGGAIAIHSKLPVDSFESEIKMRVGNHGERLFAGVVNLPVSDSLAVRLNGGYRKRDGFGVNHFNGDELGGLEAGSFRGAALWKPSDEVTVTVRADYGKSDSTGMALKILKLIPGGLFNAEASVESGLSMSDARALYESYSSGKFQDSTLNVHPTEDAKVWGGSATVEWDISSDMQLKSITAYRGFTQIRDADLDVSPFSGFAYREFRIEDKQFSQELQLSGASLSDRLRWVAGIYLYEEDGSEFGYQDSINYINIYSPSTQEAEITNKSKAVFAQGTYEINAQWSTTIGMRYTKDSRYLLSRNQDAGRCLALGVVLSGDPCERPMEKDFSKPSYTASLEYAPNSDHLIYVKTGSSYRSGGFPFTAGSAVSPEGADIAFTPFLPEMVTDYEIGVKSQWMNNTLRTNLAVYRSKYEDGQTQSATLVPGSTALVNFMSNDSSATIDGAEFELTALPSNSIEVQFTAAYMNGRYGKEVASIAGVGRPPMVWAPKWTTSVSFSHTSEWSFGSMRAQLDYSWVDERYSNRPANATTEPYDVFPSLGLVNGRISLWLFESDLEISVYARNIANKDYYSFKSNLAPLGAVIGQVGQPRTFGVELSKKW